MLHNAPLRFHPSLPRLWVKRPRIQNASTLIEHEIAAQSKPESAFHHVGTSVSAVSDIGSPGAGMGKNHYALQLKRHWSQMEAKFGHAGPARRCGYSTFRLAAGDMAETERPRPSRP